MAVDHSNLQLHGAARLLAHQVYTLDLQNPSSPWRPLPARGSVPIARVGCAACVLPSQKMLVLHGGMLCSHSVQGR